MARDEGGKGKEPLSVRLPKELECRESIAGRREAVYHGRIRHCRWPDTGLPHLHLRKFPDYRSPITERRGRGGGGGGGGGVGGGGGER